MARQMKVYGGCYDGSNRVIVAASSKKAAWEAAKKIWPSITYYSWNEFTSDTGNDAELAAALSQPNTVLTQSMDARDGVFKKAVR